MGNFIDMRGQRFNRLLVLDRAPNKGKQTIWKCVCDCGQHTHTNAYDLRRGHAQSCGCLMQEVASSNFTTHGATKRRSPSPEYRTWLNIKNRCTYAGHVQWKDYGGRGIKMCERWLHSFENFLCDMGPKPSPDHSIERIDRDGDYTPENCKWAGRLEQASNKRNNVFLTVDGVTATLAQWSRASGVKEGTIRYRLRKGIDVKQAVFQPV